MDFDQTSLRGTAYGRTTTGGSTTVSGRDHLDPPYRRAVERFTRTLSLVLHLLATAERVGRRWRLRPGLGATAEEARSPRRTGLGSGDGRCDVRTGQKGGFSVGKTKKGKGTKLLVLIDGQGLPLGISVDSAQRSDVRQIEPLLEERILDKQSPRLIYDRAADCDALRDRLAETGIELICPHRKNRKRPAKQDGRKLRRYRHRWHVEQTISWLGNCRRLLVRHEHFDHLYYGFAQLACIRLLLKRLMAL